MATTTNYGWTTPDDTALVKDGAAAIRTLGSSVDTTTKNLNPQTTLGDLAYRSSTSNVNTRLGIGTTGQVLSVSGGVPAWATASSGGMTLLATHTLSGSTSTISSISGSHKSLLAVMTGATTTGSGTNWKIDPNGSTTITSNTTLESGTGYNYSSTWYLNINNVKQTGANNCWSFTIDNYASTSTHKPIKTSGQFVLDDNSLGSMNAGGGIRTTSAITSLDFVTLSGSFNGGTVLLYGVS